MATDVAAIAAALGMTPRPVPVVPTEEVWRSMTLEQREDFIMTVNEALSDPLIAMSEGRPHKKAVRRLEEMVSNLEERAEQAARDVERASLEANKGRGSLRKAIVRALVARGVTCSEQTLAHLESCTDTDVLEQWLDRAFTANNEADLFVLSTETSNEL